MEILKYSLILMLLTGCGSKLDDKIGQQNKIVGVDVIQGFKTEGILTNINEESFSLPIVTDKPRIIIFAATFCGICQEEHRNLRDLFSQNNSLEPSNVEIITIMTDSADNSDALDFKDFTQIQWSPYYQKGDELRNKLCGIGSATPCVVIEKPSEGIVFQHIGKVPIEQLMNITGAWLW